MSAITEMSVTEAILALMRGPTGSGHADPALAATLAVRVRPDLLRVFGAKAPADLTGDSTFKTLVSSHISQPAAAGDEQQRLALLRLLQNGNVHSADYSTAVATAARAPHAGDFAARIAAVIAGGEGRASAASSIERTLGLSSGYHTAHNLSAELRAHVDGPRASAAQVASAANYASSIGLDPGRYAGHFVGTSQVAQKALEAHIRSGAAVTDQHITNPNDARAVIAAIQAGKMKPEAAPPSVQKIMDDMKAKGIDPASASAKDIGAYFQQNPKALEAAKAQDKADQKAAATLTPQGAAQAVEAAAPATRRPSAPAATSGSPLPTRQPAATTTL